MKKLLALVLILVANATAQQGRGSIQGTVTDSSGAVVAGANVRIVNVDTNSTFATVTSDEGYYSAPTLAVGNYHVTIEKPGFKQVVRTGITLQVDQRAQVAVNSGSRRRSPNQCRLKLRLRL